MIRKIKPSQASQPTFTIVAIVFLMVFFSHFVSAVWWNPFTWFQDEGIQIGKGEAWVEVFNDNPDFYSVIPDKSKHDADIYLCSKSATKNKDLKDLDFATSFNNIQKELKTKAKLKPIKYEGSYCYYYKPAKDEKFLKFGEHSTHFVYTNESITATEDNIEIGKLSLITEDFKYKNSKPNINLGFGNNLLTHTFYIENWTNESITNLKTINLKNNEEVERNAVLKFLTYESIEEPTYNKNCTTESLSELYPICSPYQNGTIIKLKEKWINKEEVITGNDYVVGVFADVQNRDYIDINFDYYGTSVLQSPIDWATWTGDFYTNLISAWKFEESSGDLIDYYGSNDGTVTGATREITGKDEYGYSFDGAGDYVNMGNPADLKIETGTISAWIKNDGQSGAVFHSFFAKPQAFALGIRINSGDKLAFYDWGGGDWRDTGTDITTGTWHHVVLTINSGGTAEIWLDNSSEGNFTHSVNNQNYDFQIGSTGSPASNEDFAGDIDEVYIWDRVLSDAEIYLLYDDTFIPKGIPPSVTLTSPANNSNLTSSNQDFTVEVTDDLRVEWVGFYLDGVLEENRTTHVNGTYIFSETLIEGPHSWYIVASDNQSLINQSANYSLNVTILSPIITLNNPENNVYLTNQIQSFNGTVWDDIGVVNVSLLIDGNIVETNTSGFNNSDYLFTYNFGADGSYTWAYKSWDITDSSTSTRNINIDTVAPVLSITDNNNSYTYILPINKTVDMSVIDDNVDTCIYWTSDNSTNNTVSCGTPFNISFTTGGNKTVYTWVNDSAGQIDTEQDNFFIYYLQDSVDYITPVIELDIQTIYLNVTATEINKFNANLTYNGTIYPMVVSNNGTLGQAYVQITNPGTSIITFNFTYTINDFTNTTKDYSQTINALTPINVTTENCNDLALTFILQNEVNSTNLTGTIAYNFKYGPSNNNEYLKAYGTEENTTVLNVCINATATEYYYIGYGEIQYTVDDYVDRRFYLFEDSAISNNTYATHYLRELSTSSQTSFLLTLEDTDLNKYLNKYTALWRWYPDLNDYRIVEMGKTDEDGQTVIHVRTEDVDYRTALYELNGSLIKLDSPRRFLCTSSPCSLNIVVGESDADLTAFYDVESLISYNETTGIISYVYNDPNQLTHSMRLKVDKLAGNNIITICDDTSAGFTGVMACNISAYSGTFKVTAYRTASPETPVSQKLINTVDTLFRSSFGLFFSAFIWLAIVLSALLGSPILTLIFAIVGLIPALFFGSINLAIFTGLIVMVAIVLHFIKRSLG